MVVCGGVCGGLWYSVVVCGSLWWSVVITATPVKVVKLNHWLFSSSLVTDL